MTDQWKKIEKYAYLGIALSLIILVIISSTSYQSLIKIKKDFNWAASTREVLFNLSYFLSSLKNANAEQLESLLTDNDKNLEPYKYIENRVKSHFKGLHVIALDNAVQQSKIDVCEALVMKKLQNLQDLINLQKDNGPEASKEIILTGIGKQIMEEIQELVLEMDKDGRDLLDQRSRSINLRIRLDAAVKIASIVILLVASILIISRISYLFKVYKKVMTEQMELVDMKSNFVSNVSHELRTPLKAIRESISIVLNEQAGSVNEEQKKFLVVSERNVDRLAKLIDDVLDFQKLDAGKTKLNMHDNDMNEVVEEVHELMTQPAKKNGLSFVMKLDRQLPKIMFDRDKITQVLTNIVNNAIKFTEKGEITITTSCKGNALYVSVQDTGIGIAEKNLLKIFNRFEQISNTKYGKASGTGLGLSISKEIIQLHKGKIWAESKLGMGTTVWFLLPIVERRKH